MTDVSIPVRFSSSWQRLYCETCREETNHHKNACVHCGAHPGASRVVNVTAQYNGRLMGRLTDAQRTEARRLLNSGTPPKVIASILRVTPSTVYRLNPLTRG